MHKIGVPIKRDITIFIIFSAWRSKSNINKGVKIIIGRHVMIQTDNDLDKKIVSSGMPDM